ncbi:dihydropyrimidine dehydrogenase (NADP+)/dihydropyrimidine dehydrogenase (NAD+) subunit PreA [Haloferula luteola]|uniref:dihydrouracil dehydrogenase (NAD(+)) n=1 Tax=Haloferula luteola TaxID=595692 RepID=A0A840V7F4_9BACT|nr:NAD-dependent dihydropyrimidine dehydrogenase subunit PreA [Haloferula luteola]MBB5351514.1 dihydropyrimidine dehydrogenase (NADP+)/dihydropyrimidine dehydrogenase (NAD+) subunit PreA [Haloferula luteola]
MPTLSTTVDGLHLPNPFVIGSGPPGTNLKVIQRAFKEGWGAVIAKTISLDASKVVNVGPRYAKLKSADGNEVIGWENIELISDRPFEKWLDEFKECKDSYPDGVLIASVMEEFNKDAWCEIIERCQEVGVDGFELNFSCPHGLPERKMGAAMGQDPAILEEVCGWVNEVAKIPVWAKMTPNVTHIEDPGRAALRAGCEGLAAINTIRSVMGVDLETLRPEPTVEGFTTPGGYSSKAVKPIALRMVMELATMIRKEFPGKSLSAIGGVESGWDAAQFILLGGDTVQVCTGVMKFGYPVVQRFCDELLEFMESKGFETLDDFKGHSLQYFTTHAELVRMQTERKAKEAAKKAGMVTADGDWDGDDFVKQSDGLARN